MSRAFAHMDWVFVINLCRMEVGIVKYSHVHITGRPGVLAARIIVLLPLSLLGPLTVSHSFQPLASSVASLLNLGMHKQNIIGINYNYQHVVECLS